LGGADLAVLLERFDEQFAGARARSIARRSSPRRRGARPASGFRRPVFQGLLLLDVPIDSEVEFEFVKALLASSPRASRLAPRVLVTIPFGDIATMNRFKSLGLERELLEQTGETDLVALRRYLFARSQPPAREAAGDVSFFSAPGEGRESVEIARRVLREARGGVPFDEMAVWSARRSATSDCSNMRSGARACRLVRTRHAAPASRRPRRSSRSSPARANTVRAAVCRIPLAGAGPAPRRSAARAGVRSAGG
jgi:hypothetical protein